MNDSPDKQNDSNTQNNIGPSTRIMPSGFNTPDRQSQTDANSLKNISNIIPSNKQDQDGTINFSDLPNHDTTNLVFSDTNP